VLTFRAATVPTVAAAPAPKVRGYAAIEKWGAVITDPVALIKWIAEAPRERMGYLTFNQTKLNQAAAAMTTSLAIPGVEARSTTTGRPTGR
jgi:hypothetical protein